MWPSRMYRKHRRIKAKAVDCPDDIELHKPYIDEVHLKCPECGKK